MQQHTNGKLFWLTFDLFSDMPRLVHGIFLRHGGVSSGDFQSLNFGDTQGDCPKNIKTNREEALSVLNMTRYCHLWQYHSALVVEARPYERMKGDGLTTHFPNLALLILHADCQAAIFYDPIHHVLSNIHCGWKGNVQNIYKETVEVMKSLYGSKPEDLLVGISPSLGPQACEFINFKKELPLIFNSFQFKENYFNFWEISRFQLTECGLLSHHIEIAEICTFGNPQDFFSYRRLKVSGRHATIAALK